jgi:hypothetical protein
MVRSNVRVLLRTRPTDNFASDAVHIDGSNKVDTDTTGVHQAVATGTTMTGFFFLQTVSIKHGVKTFLGDRDSNTQLQQVTRSATALSCPPQQLTPPLPQRSSSSMVSSTTPRRKLCLR